MFTDTITFGSIAAIITIISAITVSTWNIRGFISGLETKFIELLNKHEDKDMERFFALDIRLARMGNGSYSETIRRETADKRES